MNSDFDIDILNDELMNAFDSIDMSDFGFDLNFDDEDEEKEIIEDEVPEIPEEPKAKLGDIYQLGNHRLMCGDSTSEEDVNKLMNGTKADMVFTDPPYGVEIKGKYTGTILNDNLKDDDLENFLKEVNNNIKNNCNGSYYICYEVLNSVENFNAFGKPDEIICINKDSASMPFGKNRYNRKFELILYYKKNGELICESEPNVWDTPKSSSFNNRDENGLRFNEKGNYCVAHPTTKPLLVPSRAIKNSSKEKNIILDLFGGSGSTLIACEQLNRKCYMMELDPHYIDVIIQRWENFTGEKAVLLNREEEK
jgi:site-specific DNA-methyltransferase (adenine-specific)